MALATYTKVPLPCSWTSALKGQVSLLHRATAALSFVLKWPPLLSFLGRSQLPCGAGQRDYPHFTGPKDGKWFNQLGNLWQSRGIELGSRVPGWCCNHSTIFPPAKRKYLAALTQPLGNTGGLWCFIIKSFETSGGRALSTYDYLSPKCWQLPLVVFPHSYPGSQTACPNCIMSWSWHAGEFGSRVVPPPLPKTVGEHLGQGGWFCQL